MEVEHQPVDLLTARQATFKRTADALDSLKSLVADIGTKAGAFDIASEWNLLKASSSSSERDHGRDLRRRQRLAHLHGGRAGHQPQALLDGHPGLDRRQGHRRRPACCSPPAPTPLGPPR